MGSWIKFYFFEGADWLHWWYDGVWVSVCVCQVDFGNQSRMSCWIAGADLLVTDVHCCGWDRKFLPLYLVCCVVLYSFCSCVCVCACVCINVCLQTIPIIHHWPSWCANAPAGGGSQWKQQGLKCCVCLLCVCVCVLANMPVCLHFKWCGFN